MKKYFTLILSCIILVFQSACSNSAEKSQQEDKKIESTPPALKLSKVIEGQWKAEGAEGVAPHWREFDPSNNTFRSWDHNGPRLSKPDGFYEIIGDTVLQMTFEGSEITPKYGLDSLSEDYLEFWYYGVSASNLIYHRDEYEETHLKDIRNDTIAVEGTILQATDIGWAYTYGLLIDVGTDTLAVNYFTQEYFENTLRGKQVSLRYFNSIEYNYPHANSESQVFEITGIYKILSYGGDLPGQYSITDKSGRSIVFDAFLNEEDSKTEGTEVTRLYIEHYKINIASLEVKQPIMNTLIFGDWNIVASDATPTGHHQIKIRPGGKKGVYIDFGGQGDNYVAADIYSNTLTGESFSGKWTLELVSNDPATFIYSDDGNGGHYEPIKNQKYQKKDSNNRELLIGKWQGINGTEFNIEFTDKEMRYTDSSSPYVLSSVIYDEELHERFSQYSTGDVVYITTMDDGMSELSYRIDKLNKDSLSYTYMGTKYDFSFKRVK